MPTLDCECCGRTLPASQVPYLHSGRDGRPDTQYCQDCYDVGCDLETCDLPDPLTLVTALEAAVTRVKATEPQVETCLHCMRQVPLAGQGRFISHDVSAYQRMVCPGAGLVPIGPPPTQEELAEVYRSLGVEPPEEE